MHHGLAKAALFLSVGLTPLLARKNILGYFYWVLVAVPALAMAGLPFSSGAIAKSALKISLVDLDGLVTLFTWTAVGTTLLMLRFLALLSRAVNDVQIERAVPKVQRYAYVLLVFLVLTVTYWIPQASLFIEKTVSINTILNAVWPLFVGMLFYFIIRLLLVNISLQQFVRFMESGITLPKRILGTCYFVLHPRRTFFINHFWGPRSILRRVDFEHHGSPVSRVFTYCLHPGVVFISVLMLVSLALVYRSV